MDTSSPSPSIAELPPRDLVRATVLFADILGFEELAQKRSPDDAFAITTRCLRRLDEIARRHEGAIDKYLGDCLMAVFGFPVASDLAEQRAVSAAWAMREAVHDLRVELALGDGFDIRIGINSGPILAGDVGGDVIREFAVMGDAVNLAARLKAGAPAGAIHVGPDTKQRVDEAFRFQALAERAVKGRQQLVRPFALVGVDASPRRAGSGVAVFCELVGREAELARLEARLEAARAGAGSCIFITGAEGVGKSRLVAELAARHPDAAFREIRGDDARRELNADAGGAWRVLVAETDDLAGPEAATALGERLSLIPVLPIMLVVITRAGPSEAHPSWRALRTRAEALGDRFEALHMDALDAEATERMIAALSGDAALDAETRALVVQRARGNPSRVIQGVFLSDALRADAARAERQPDRGDEAERRRATVLFADLTGFTALAERSEPRVLHALVTSCLDELSAIARRHGGHVEKHLGDCILALFGAPVAMEDAPRAAVNAALEMRDRVARFNRERSVEPPLEIHTGIDTGLGIAGDVSGPVIREFTLMGESVANASRLMDEARPGEIFAGEQTVRATDEWFEYVERGAGAYELRSREIRIHREAGRTRRIHSALVGRDEELAVLGRAIERLKAGHGGAVSVVGDAGIGKSRLVKDLLDGLGDDVVHYQGRSLSVGQGLGFHPIADLLSHWCGRRPDDDDARARARLDAACEALMGDAASEVAPFLAAVMGLPASDAERDARARMDGDAMERLILGAVTRLLREGAARRPLVLVFEDLHWADSSSLELLESLLRLPKEKPILFLAILRPGYEKTGERFRGAASERLGDAYREISVEPLASNAALELLRNLFRGGDVPPALLAAVRARAHGNPFYVEEVVRNLLDAQALVDREGRLQATASIDRVEIPGTLQEVVMARVDRLDRPKRNVLRAAAAIGASFRRDVLADVVDRDDLADLLAGLIEADLIELRSRGDELRFAHPLIQEVVYGSLVGHRRETLHRAIGAAIEARVAPGAAGYHAQLAFHYGRGRDIERAEPHLFLAGDEAARASASDEALEFFREASALYVSRHGSSGDREKLALLERNIARALANRGRYVEAISHFDAALRHRVVRVTDNTAVLGVRLIRDLALVLARLYLPRGGSKRRAATDRQRAVQELIYDRARAQTTSAMDRYLFDWMDGLRRLQSVDPTTIPLAGGQLASTVGIFSYGGVSFAISERFLEQARSVVRADDPTEKMIFGFMNFFHHVLAGDWSDGHEVAIDLVRDRIRNGQLFDVTNYLAFCAEKRIHQGRYEAAEETMTLLREIADLYQFDLAVSSLHALSAAKLLEREEYPEAVVAADRHYTEHRDPLLNLLALGTRAKAELLAGDPEAARHSLETAEALLASAPGVVPPYQKSAVLRSRLLLEVHDLELGTGRRGAPRRAARRALAAAARVACRRPEVMRLEARRCALVGDARGAARWLSRARAEATRLGMEPELRRIEAEARFAS